MGQAAGAADTAADTGHALDKVRVEQILALLEERHAAFLDAVAGRRLQLEILAPLFLERLGNGVGEAAAARKDAAEIGRIVQAVLGQRRNVQIAAVEERLKLLEGKRDVYVRFYAVFLNFRFLRGARSYKNNLARRFVFFKILRNRAHRRKVMRNVFLHIREILLYEIDERGATRAC